jgi:hypothetical protein
MTTIEPTLGDDINVLELPSAALLGAESGTGTIDDEDDPSDENAEENEIPVGDVPEGTEAPEEFEVDDEDDVGHPEDDDADDDDDFDDDDVDDGEVDETDE